MAVVEAKGQEFCIMRIVGLARLLPIVATNEMGGDVT